MKFPLQTLMLLGPGIIAAASGNDAGGIATYTTVGAKYGYSFLWVLVLLLAPSLAIVQIVSIRLGIVSGKGLSALIRERFPLKTAMVGILSLFAANSIIAISEFFGIAAALELFGISKYIGVPIAGMVVWGLIVIGSYQKVEKLFLVLSTIFLAYIGSSFLGRPIWGQAFKAMVTPTFSLDTQYLTLFIATIATTITPYMQIYAQSATLEKGLSLGQLKIAQLDAALGSIFSTTISIFIVITAAATLFPHGIVVETASDAALALTPLAGNYASILFGVGLLAASMLAAGVLPLTTAFSTCEAFGWRAGVRYSYRQAPIFYSIITILIALGVTYSLIPGISLIKPLIFAFVLNGFLLPVELYFMLRLANDKELMGKYVNNALLNIVTGVIMIIVTVAVILFLLSLLPISIF